MAQAIIMPKLGLNMSQGTVTEWYVQVGDAVTIGQPLFAIETDKLTHDVESIADGTVLKIVAQVGDSLKIAEPCCYVGAPGEAIPEGEASAVAEAAPAAPAAPAPVAQAAPVPAAAPAALVASAPAPGGRVFASPRARKLAGDFGVDVAAVPASGERVTGEDVIAYIESRRVKITPVAKKLAAEKGLDPASLAGSGPGGRIEKKDVEAALLRPATAAPAPTASPALIAGGRTQPMSAMRKTIAQRLSLSKQTIPHVYYRREVDATSLLNARALMADAALNKNGVKLTINDFILKAAAQVLSEFEDVNAQTDGESVTYFDTVNLGMAVSVPTGLVVPVLRGADGMSLSEISKTANALAEKARNGKLSMDDYTGGTFTVSNLGGYGMDEFAAIINPPEAGILAVGAAKKKPVVVGDAIEIRPMMWLTGSFDHRLVDGALAARFMQRLVEVLENALTLFV